MYLRGKDSRQLFPWFWLGMITLFLFSAILRFWDLSKFNSLVFDEVYYAQYGVDYLNKKPFFDAHPPLGKYLIAFGIWVGSHLPIGNSVNNLTGSQLSSFSYRWLNALTGSLIPLIVASIAYQLSQRRSYALIAGLLTAVDGLFLVESRYALINIYLIFFGLLGQLCFLVALNKFQQRKLFLALSGICFGAAASVKWYGLGFLLGIFLVWGCAAIGKLIFLKKNYIPEILIAKLEESILTKLTLINPGQLLVNLGLIPIIIYLLIWIPHLQINPQTGLWELHKQIFAYHQNLGTGSQEHPYCSVWYSWPLMLRPMSYFFEKIDKTPTQVSPLLLPSAAAPETVIQYHDVHGMGNPVLWWLSAIAILVLFLILILRIKQFTTNINQPAVELSVIIYLLLNYCANYLPWIMVTRCSFIYYYMGALIFAILALAWLIDQYLHYRIWQRGLGVTIIFLILCSFVFWIPIFLGLPLSPDEFQSRMWLKSWI